VVAWLDERGDSARVGGSAIAADDATIFSVSSSSFGASWGANRPLWGGVCPCCRVSLARDPDGGVIAAWRSHLPGDIRDVVTARLGAASRSPARVHADDWVYPGCPHSGPALTVDPHGATHVVWYSGKPGEAGVLYSRTPPSEIPRHVGERASLVSRRSLPPAHPSVVSLGREAVLAAYDVRADGVRATEIIRIDSGRRISGRTAIPGGTGGVYPQVVALPTGDAMVAWTVVEGGVSRVRLARVRLSGNGRP
jgi:hypothetical protein